MIVTANEFKLKLLNQSRPKRTIEHCQLCHAIKTENPILTKNGYILDPKYPSSPDEKLYIRKRCILYPSIKNIQDTLEYLNQNKVTICLCNMLDKPSIQTHWHTHFVKTKHLSKTLIDYWDKESKRYPQNKTNKIKNQYGNFTLIPFGKNKAEAVARLYKGVLRTKGRTLIAFTTDYIIFCNIQNLPNELTVTSSLIYGYLYTRSKTKYKSTKKYGADKIIKNYSVPITFKLNRMQQTTIKQIAEILTHKNTNPIAKKWYKQMGLNVDKLTQVKPLVLPKKYASDIQLQYKLDSTNNINFVNIKCTFEKALTNERTNERVM